MRLADVDTVTMPAHWASALINGDASGMTDREERLMDRYVERVLYEHGWQVVDVIGEPYFTWRYRLHGGDAEGGEVVDYHVHRYEEEDEG